MSEAVFSSDEPLIADPLNEQSLLDVGFEGFGGEFTSDISFQSEHDPQQLL
jgi:hypothetical protein